MRSFLLQKLTNLRRPISLPNPAANNSGRTLTPYRRDTHTQIMGVSKEDVESSLASKLNPSHLVETSEGCLVELCSPILLKDCVLRVSSCYLVHQEVVDTSGGCGASFMVEIVSDQFEGKRLLERHRMVNSALEKEMKEIHALSITKALTPEQWKQQQVSAKSGSTS